MTRYVYGGGGDAQVMATSGGVPITSAAHVYSARTGGSIVTDVLNIAGGALAGVVTPDSRGQVLFQGPDGMLSTLWLDFADGGPRWSIKPTDLEGSIAAKRAALALAEYNSPGAVSPKSMIPYTPGTISQGIVNAIDGRVPQRFANDAARNAAIPTPSDGDYCYNQALHGMQVYNGLTSSWRALPTVFVDASLPNSTQNALVASGLGLNWDMLRVIWWGRAVGSASATNIFNPVRLQFNSDTGTNYGYMGRAQRVKIVSGVPTAEVGEDGTGGSSTGASTTAMSTTAATYANLNNMWSAGASSAHIGYVPGSSAPAGMWGTGILDIPLYGWHISGSQKAFHAQSGFGNAAGVSGTNYQCNTQMSGGWAQTGVSIGTISLFLAGGATWANGSTFAFYGF